MDSARDLGVLGTLRGVLEVAASAGLAGTGDELPDVSRAVAALLRVVTMLLWPGAQVGTAPSKCSSWPCRLYGLKQIIKGERRV